MENFHSNNIPLYRKSTEMNSHIQLMNTQMGSPFPVTSGGYYNLNPMTSSPMDSYTLDNLENIDPQILMSWSSNSSSGDNFSSPSALNRARYRGGYGRSPLSLVESLGNSTSSSVTRSPSVFSSGTLSTDEDVLVMDEVMVVNALGGRSRSGKDLSGSSFSSVKNYKMDVCHSWVETGSCRFGSSCQFSHRKEDLTLAKFSNKGDPELEICFPRSPFTKPSQSSFRGHNYSPTMSRGAAVYGRSPQGSAKVGNNRGSPSDRSSCRDNSVSATSRDDGPPLFHSDWVPQDDAIDARLPGSDNPSRYEVSACINRTSSNFQQSSGIQEVVYRGFDERPSPPVEFRGDTT
ncbi:hypothetical protein QQ045_014717 [Rhodiola kirilowii]